MESEEKQRDAAEGVPVAFIAITENIWGEVSSVVSVDNKREPGGIADELERIAEDLRSC